MNEKLNASEFISSLCRLIRFCGVLLILGLVFFSAATVTAITINEFPNAGGDGGITSGPDGNLWVTLYKGSIGRITTSGIMSSFQTSVALDGITAITKGPDGNLWFTESIGNKIGRITPEGIIVEFLVPTAGSGPNDITLGPDGNLWFTERVENKIGRITPQGILTEFNLPSGSILPGGITSGPDGNVWFTVSFPSRVGRITPAGVITEFAVSDVSGFPDSITTGPDGNLWFIGSSGNIGRITPAGESTEFALPIIPSPPGTYIYKQLGAITTAPDGNLWFTEQVIVLLPAFFAGSAIVEHTSWVGRITPSGISTEFAVPTDYSQPTGITVGPDGNIWFTEARGNKLGQVVLKQPDAQPMSIPTMTEWGMIIFMVLAGFGAAYFLRDRKVF